MKPSFKPIVAATVAMTFFAGIALPAAAETNVLFIVDASGSMKKKLETGESRMEVAKKAMAEALTAMPPDARLGLLLYGHRKAKDCTDIELVSPIGADNAAAISKRISGLKAKGETPIAESLRQAQRSFAALKGQDNRIVLVTDGIEECKGDPCAAAQELRDAGFDVKVDIVGFTLTEKQRALVQCVPDITGGQYYDAQGMTGLTTALAQVAQKAAEPDNNILAQRNGGMLLAAPNDEWLKLNDSAEDRATTYGGAGVWAFRDGKPATFDTFEVLIPGKDQYNLKDFELFVGDEGPLGSFRSIGKFSTQNMKMMQAPYQKFTFAPVTARYMKVVLATDHGGGYIASHEFRVQGTVDETAAAGAAAQAPTGIDLLAQANGGQLLAAPNDEWKKLNDGAADRATTYSGAGVWGFKDGKPATFDSFEVLIPGSDQYNLKDFELLVGDEGPTGAFRSIGKFATQNVKMMQAPYQRFVFAPVTAKYLKVVFETDQGGGYVAAYDLRLFGQIDEAAIGATTAQAPAGIDLLAQSNGGMLLAAPNDEWMKLNDGAADRATTYAGEGIWAFSGEKPATFDSFEVLIPGQDQYNLKDFELLVSVEGPTGAFRSIGQFTTQNMKMMQSPYQRFTFAPVTARYLKVVFKTDHGGGYVAAYDLRLFGQIDESAAATAPATPAAAAAGVDLLAQANGGMLLGAPNDEWMKLNDGAEDRATTYDGEGIWAFKDEKPVTFDSFEVLIPGTDQYNLKDFELFVADDSPTGPFRSIGQFTTQNQKMMQSPYQRFTFPPVTARYLKVVLRTHHGGGYIAAYEFRVMGQPAP
jgi:von Willebrand factor type A domain/Sad1 / UNC-like C-terminal